MCLASKTMDWAKESASRPSVPLFLTLDIATIERKHAITRRRSAEVGQCQAVDTRGNTCEHVIDCPAAIKFDAATEFIIRRLGRPRPTFVFPNANRKRWFGFSVVGVHCEPFYAVERSNPS